MNIDVEKRRINAKLDDPVFVADFQKFLEDISFDGEGQNLRLLEKWNTFSDEELTRLCDENTRRAQETLSQIIDAFYQKHGTEYANEREFLFVLKETLRLNLKSKIASARIASAGEQAVVVSTDIEEKRAKLLSYFEDKPITDPYFMDQFLIRKEIETCEPEKLQKFLDVLKVKKTEKIIELTDDIKNYQQQLEANNFVSSYDKFRTERMLEDAERFLKYYQTADDFEVFIPLYYNSSINGGNTLISELINKNIDVARFDGEVAVLQQINNILESYDRGLIAENAIFNGHRIIDKCSGRKWHLGETDIRSFVRDIPNFSREHQTNFAYSPSTVQYLLGLEKQPQAGFERFNDDGTIDRFVVYSVGLKSMQPERTLAPLFVKHIQEDPAKNTCSVMMYVFEEPDLKFGTQLFRIDKVQPIARWGDPASHRQSSGDVIETNVHVHDYDLFDRVLINTRKLMELGHSDVSNNFVTQVQLDNRVLELFVNQKFNIEREIRKENIQSITQTAPSNQ